MHWLFFALALIMPYEISFLQTPPQVSGSERQADSGITSLSNVKRIYVDSFGDDTTSREVQSMIVSALVATGQFKVTENRLRADAVMKGVATERSSQELHAYSEGTAVGARGGAGIQDSSANTETLHDAKVSLRLVNTDGDVIWTVVQESKGAKYKGPAVDAADKCIKQLVRDTEKLKNSQAAASSSTVPRKAD